MKVGRKLLIFDHFNFYLNIFLRRMAM